ARRTGDDAQHLRGRRLLLQRLGELLFQLGVGCAKAVDVSCGLRRLRTRTGRASSALRHFARQAYLAGIFSGALAVGPAKDRPDGSKQSGGVMWALSSGGEPRGALLPSGAGRPRGVLGRTGDPPATDLRTSVESSLRTLVEI